MPKLKTHGGAKRRFRITGTGKFMRMKGNRSHNRRKKSNQSLRAMDEMQQVDKGWTKTLRKLLPYG